MAYANGTSQDPTPEPVVVERGSGYSVHWPQPEPQPQPQPES
jgi:hypothetical protein